MVTITIDGKQIEVAEGTTVLRAAQLAGIPIPTLCDHPNLEPYGGCRLCLVEIDGARTLQPSCTMPAGNGMVVHTDSERIRDARKFVLSLLFSERNHFCMYCQVSGGDCELQNAAYGQDMTHWPLQPNWTPYPVDASNPYFVLDNNRCILCRRCVRACADLVGNATLGIEERGADCLLVADLGIPIGQSSCISCGTCVQICPTGALIDRQSAYLGKETQVETVESTCVACSLGCGVKLLTRDNRLVRIEGDWDASVNGGLLCKAGRFQPMVEERERVLTPLVRVDGVLKAATWAQALGNIAAKIKPMAGKNGDGIAAFASTRLPAESLAAFKELFADRLGSSLVTSIEEGTATADSGAVARELGHAFEGSLSALDSADFVLTAGVDLANQHQVAGFFIRRRLLKGARLAEIASVTPEFGDLADYLLQPKPDSLQDLLLGLLVEIAQHGMAKGQLPVIDLRRYALDAVSARTGIPAETLHALAHSLASASKPVLIFGEDLGHDNSAAIVKTLADLATALGENATVLSPKGGANSVAAALYGLESNFKLNGQQAVYVAIGDDQLNPNQIQRLKGIPFLAVQSAYASPLTEMADVVLPVEMWSEQEGHYVNLEGRLQVTHKAIAAPDGVRSNLEALTGLAEHLGYNLDVDWKTGLAGGLTAVALKAA